jgi:hypothetical protein
MRRPFEIVWAKTAWLQCSDERPWLIVDVRHQGEEYGAFPISTKIYRSGGPYYMIEDTHSDFRETGLKSTSYLFYESIIEIGDDDIRRPLGRIVGTLLAAVREASGL